MSPREPKPAAKADERPKRISLSEIVALLLQRSGGDRSSVSLSRNARGVTQIEVTIRTGDTAEVATPLEAERHAVEIYERLRARYTLPSGYVGAEGEPPAAKGARDA